MGTANASVLWKANSAVRQKMAGFNLLDGGFHQLAKFPALFFVDGCLQILNLRHAPGNKHNQGDIRDSGHPGVADELRIERQETLGLFRIARSGRFPIDAFRPVQLANRIDVRYKLASARKSTRELGLEIPLRVSDSHTIVLGESFEQANALVIQPVPGIVLGILEGGILMFLPCLKERGGRIFFGK
jgi:hypothetical protein